MGGYSGLPNGFVPGGTASLADIITGMGQEKGAAEQAQAQPALTRATTAHQQALATQEDINAKLASQKLKDAEILRNAYSTLAPNAGAAPGGAAPTGPSDPDAMMNQVFTTAVRNGLSAPAAMEYQNHMLSLRKNRAAITEDERKTDAAKHEEAGSLLLGINALPEEQRPAAYAQAHPRLDALEPGALPPEYPGADHFGALVGGHALSGALLGQKKTGAEITNLGTEADKNTALANEAKAATGGKQAESEKQQLVLKAMKDAMANPASGEQAIKDALPLDPTAAGSYLSAWKAKMGAGDIQGAAEEVGKAAAHNALISQAVNPQMRAGKVADALAIETATNPLKLQQARAQAGATAGVREALKLDQDYVKSASATEEIGKVLDLADSGNKAAASALSTVGAISLNAVNGLKRLNRQEITGLGGETAGNAYDRVVGFFGGATTGQKIPENIRNDIRSLHQSIGENAYHTYTTGLDALSKRSGTAYAPTVQAPSIRKGAGGGPTAGAIEQGYRFKGGDPAKQENWEKVQ